MFRIFIIFMLLVPQSLWADEMAFSYGLESFYWEEFDDGESLLDESGFRHVLGLDLVNRIDRHWSSDLRAHVTLGTVEYDGQYQSGEPVKSDTEYRGYGLEAGFHYFPRGQYRSESAQMGLRLAVGLDRWTRSIQGSGGYDEEYQATYGRVAMLYQLPDVWEFEFGVRVPNVVSEEIDLSDYGYVETIEINPKGQPTLYALFDYPITDDLAIKLRYDSYHFAESNSDIVYNRFDGQYYEVYQPKSDMQMLGLSVSLAL